MELADVLERFNNGAASLVMIRNGAIELKFFELARWLGEARNRKAISERLEAAGYTVIRNPDETTRGRWRVLQMDGSSTIPRAIYGPATPCARPEGCQGTRIEGDTLVMQNGEKLPFLPTALIQVIPVIPAFDSPLRGPLPPSSVNPPGAKN